MTLDEARRVLEWWYKGKGYASDLEDALRATLAECDRLRAARDEYHAQVRELRAECDRLRAENERLREGFPGEWGVKEASQ